MKVKIFNGEKENGGLFYTNLLYIYALLPKTQTMNWLSF